MNDEIPQDRLPHRGVAREVGIERLREKRLAKSWVALYACRYRILEFPCECHKFLHVALRLLAALATTIVGPAFFRRLDGLLLALLDTAAQEYHEAITVLAKINPISWSSINLPFEHACPDAFHVRPVADSQLVERRRNLCRGHGIESLNHAAKGERACGSIFEYSYVRHICSNVNVTITHRGSNRINVRRAIQRQSISFIWSIWFISFPSFLNQTNQRNQIDQTDQMNQIPATRREMLDCLI